MAELVNAVASFTYDNLIGGINPVLVTKNITLASGAGKVARGTVLGKVTKGAVTAAATVGNTGNGTCGSLVLGAKAKVGAYTLKATSATVFSVIDPDGIRLADAAVGTAYAGAVNFTLTAGSAAFAAGDSFTVTVAAAAKDSSGNFKYKVVNSANVDGSQTAECVLAYAADATSADAVAVAYMAGCFNIPALVFGGSDTYAAHADTLRSLDILLTTEKGA